MNLKTISNVKGICSATLLSCLVIVSVVLTQPDKVDNTGKVDNVAVVSNIGQPQGGIPPRDYDSRTTVSSRADKPENPAQPIKPTTDFTYSVKSGDTLSGLALTYGVSVKNIIAVNGLDSDKLSLNQELLIPASGKVKAISSTSKTAPKSVKTVQISSSKATVSRTRFSGRAVGQLIKWSESRNIFGIGDVATVIDVNTGYMFKIKRKGGHNHADCEPLSSADTAVMKKIYGSWSWDRRAIVVEVNGRKIAASMAGMPHGSDNISNGFSGHFDVHFSGSMTHGSEYTKSRVAMVDPDHQAMVKKAAGK
jgi:LysM repeat protein